MKIQGKEYKLVFNLTAIAEFEEMTGLNALEGFDPSKMGVKESIALTHCGLIEGGDYEMDLKELGRHLQVMDFKEVFTKFAESYNKGGDEGK